MIGRFAIILLALSPVAIVFQNCGKGFQAAEMTTLNGSSIKPPVIAPVVTPVILFTNAAPPNYSNQKSLTFSFGADTLPANQAANTNLVFQCRLDSNTYSSCSSPVTIPVSSEGSHTFYVEATNPSGGVAQISQSWASDFTAPTLMINTPPAPVTNSTSASIAFSVTDALSGVALIECSLDNSAFAPCMSPFTQTGLTSGAHTFQILATDNAGNISTIQSAAWRVDATIPTVTITPEFTSPTNNTMPSFEFTANDNGQALTTGFQCQLDAGAFASCKSPLTLSTLSQGQHVLAVKVTNAVGTVSATATDTFVFDTTPPTISNLVGPSDCTQGSCTSTATFTAADSLSGVASIKCSLNGSTPMACTSPYTITNATTGLQTLAVYATDGAGNTANASYTWTITPVATVTPTIFAATSAGLAFSTDGGSTFQTKTTANGLGSNTVNRVYGSGANIFTATTGGIAVSNDDGQTFTNKESASFSDIEASPSGAIYVTFNGGYTITADNGQTFTDGLSDGGLFYHVEPSYSGVPTDGSAISFCGTSILYGDDDGLFVSTDGGKTFSQKLALPVDKIISTGTDVFMASSHSTATGVRFSSDCGSTISYAEDESSMASLTDQIADGLNLVNGALYFGGPSNYWASSSMIASGRLQYQSGAPLSNSIDYSIRVYVYGSTILGASPNGLEISTNNGTTVTTKTTASGLPSNQVNDVLYSH